MNQTTLDLDRPAAADADRTGFDLGWDHARHALVPPAELLLEGTPIAQGWMAGRAVFGRRPQAATRSTRQWLQLRIRAWREGVAVETQQVTPHFVGQLQATHCPVLRTPLGGAATQPDAAVIERLNADAACAAGNLATLSRRAAEAWQGLDLRALVRRAREAGLEPGLSEDGLDVAAWWRLAALRSYATPLPYAEAAMLPLAVLPPNRVRLLNPAQGLQALLTLLFAAPGWAARCARVAALLPEPPLRQDFNLLVGALAPRVIEAGMSARELHHALEDAWLQPRVLRRWQQFALHLGEARAEALIEQASNEGLAVRRTMNHAPELAVEGWGLQPVAVERNAGPRIRRTVPVRRPQPSAAPRAAC